MMPLRAYLLLCRGAGEWDVTVHRELEALKDEWRHNHDDRVTAVVHVGFWRPETSAFDAIVAHWPGRVLISASARYALPTGFRVAPIPAGLAEEIPLYVGLVGWGYEITAEEVGLATGAPRCADSSPDSSALKEVSVTDWLKEEGDSQLVEDARNAGVSDECSYIANEVHLPRGLRAELGKARYRYFAGGPPSVESIIENLRFAPPWFLTLPISALSLSVRAGNCMRENSIEVVEDLTLFGVDALLKFDKFGRRSLRDVEEKLLYAFEKGPARNLILLDENRLGPPIPVVETSDSQNRETADSQEDEGKDLGDAFQKAFALLGERDTVIMRMRMGFDGTPKTLQEIGEQLGVSRERIRQRERHCINVIGRQSVWRFEVIARLQNLLAGRKDPLPLLGLEILDRWFNGSEHLEEPLKFALEHFCQERYSIIRTSGMAFVSGLPQLAWDRLVRTARRVVEASVSQQPSELDVRAMTDSLLVGVGEELRPQLWAAATEQAHFASEDGVGSSQVLVSFGSGAESAVEAVLAGSDLPLHFTEIARRCADGGRPYDVRRVHNAAANVGLLFGRGVYGLRKHFPLTAAEQDELVAEIEEFIESSDRERQWHARELAGIIEDRGLDFDCRVTPYVLSLALAKSDRLVDLGRMVWASKATGAKGTGNRIDLFQAVVALLLSEGRPMRAREIKARIERERGLTCHFQIHEEGPLVRLGTGLWGLIERDLPFSQETTQRLVDELVDVLRRRGKGLHVSEISTALGAYVPESSLVDDPMLFASLAQRDERCGNAKGGYVYLREWNESRRFTVLESVRRSLLCGGSIGLTLDEVVAGTEKVAERPIPRLLVGQMCCHLGAMYDEITMRWRYSSSVESDETLEWDHEAV